MAGIKGLLDAAWCSLAGCFKGDCTIIVIAVVLFVITGTMFNGRNTTVVAHLKTAVTAVTNSLQSDMLFSLCLGLIFCMVLKTVLKNLTVFLEQEKDFYFPEQRGIKEILKNIHGIVDEILPEAGRSCTNSVIYRSVSTLKFISDLFFWIFCAAYSLRNDFPHIQELQSRAELGRS